MTLVKLPECLSFLICGVGMAAQGCWEDSTSEHVKLLTQRWA